MDWAWNPCTGCKHGCDYCWAKKMADRYKRSFEPAFHPDRLDQPFNTKKPGVVFVCNTGDIFSPGTRKAWREKIKAAADRAPWHTYLWLTKNPQYDDSWVRPNWWLGATITGPEDAWKREVMEGENIWYSFEPLFGFVEDEHLYDAKQVVIGRATNYKSGWAEAWALNVSLYYLSQNVPILSK